MGIRPADPSDASAIGRVLRRSLEGSYSLSPRVIDELAVRYGDGEALEDRPTDEVTLVAEADGEVVGFARGRLDDEAVGEVAWLQVAPSHRGEGVGTAPFERLVEALEERGANHFRALVLADNQEGDTFLERFGLREAAERDVERAGVELQAGVFVDDEGAVGADATPVGTGGKDSGVAPTAEETEVEVDGETVAVPRSTTVEGRKLFLGLDEPIPGEEAPFFPTYDDEASEEHYGYYCANCGSTDVAMDELERLECESCGNVHLADEWDAAYL